MTTYKDATSPRDKNKTNQIVGTPDNYLHVIKKEFKIVHDLAANSENCVVPSFFSEEQDSLSQDWHKIPLIEHFEDTWLFLNPPFRSITPWARKCAEEMTLGARILLLVPASVGSKWYAEWVEPFAIRRFNLGRLTFKGHTSCYPKDLALCIYKTGLLEKFKELGKLPAYSWDWREGL